MFGYLNGKLVDTTPTSTIIDVNGIGYEIQITLHTYQAIQGKESAKLYTHLQIREDAWVMYGFAQEEEREAFKKLLAVSGVGSATSRLVLSALSAAELANIIANGDAKALEKVKGIGAKTAQRIILELKGKIEVGSDLENLGGKHNTNENDTLNALIGLGIAKGMAEAAVKKAKALAPSDELSVEEWIKSALKQL